MLSMSLTLNKSNIICDKCFSIFKLIYLFNDANNTFFINDQPTWEKTTNQPTNKQKTRK